MEIRHSTAVAKRLWNVVRITLLMTRKGVASKRKLMMDMNLMMKRGRLLRKSLSNLISQSAASNNKMARGGFGAQEYYEFSCGNTPNPVFSHVPKRNHHSSYFPCINSPEVLMEMDEYYNLQASHVHHHADHHVDYVDVDAEQPDNKKMRIYSYSSSEDDHIAEEDQNEIENENGRGVDDKAEEFITRFYEQLRAQSRMQLLQ